ncbi:MAG: hypothetical protein KA479_04015 [Saprospiraceae bacterium]|nr:hypothetical protein [Saprospiraceae bacterium]
MNYILSIFIIIIIAGCGYIPPEWINYGGGQQAITSAYHLSRKKFVFNDLIDTTVIYVAENKYVTTDRMGNVLTGLRTKYDYIRFSNSGILFIRTRMLDYPTDEIANNMERGQYCFYFIQDSTVKIEKYNHDLRNFEYWFGKIENDGDIHFYKNKGRPWGTYTGKLNYLYRKTPANLTKPIIFPTKDWEGETWY